MGRALARSMTYTPSPFRSRSSCRSGAALVPLAVHDHPPHGSVMQPARSKDPLHGITLETLLTELVDHFGWEALANEVDVRCFRFDPSIKSSLTFLRKTPWARTKVERLYVQWKQSGG